MTQPKFNSLYDIISAQNALKIKDLFQNNELLECDKAVLVHNDFADWNLLTDGNTITGALDWDECVGGSPIEEIACWSLFFDPARVKTFLGGYFSETERYENFDEKFQVMRLRYVISKMALRAKRYSYDKSEFLAKLIESGKKHLAESFEYFNLVPEIKLGNPIYNSEEIIRKVTEAEKDGVAIVGSRDPSRIRRIPSVCCRQ